MNIDFSSVIFELSNNQKTKIFFFENVKESNFFWKQFISGAFIAIVMTGLDQDMMQNEDFKDEKVIMDDVNKE